MSTVARHVLAVGAAVLGGLLNSTWNVFLRPDAPASMRLLSSRPDGWRWEHGWFVFFLVHPLFAVAYSIGTLTPEAFSRSVAATSAVDVFLVCFFSLLWGIGDVLFGLSIKVIGVAIGTSLTMAVVVIIGTLLPLMIGGNVASLGAGLTLVAVVVACCGFFFLARATLIKEGALADKGSATEDTAADGPKPAELELPAAPEDGAHKSGAGVSKPTPPPSASPTPQPPLHPLLKLLLGTMAGLFAVQLQFAFVFGEGLIDEAEARNVPGIHSPNTIWVFAFTLAAPANLAYCAYLFHRDGTWGSFFTEDGVSLLSRGLRIAAMSVLFVAHIFLYGTSQSLFGGDLGPALAWPLLMVTTVLFGNVWSMVLKEWDHAPREALTSNYVAVAFLALSATVIAVAGVAV